MFFKKENRISDIIKKKITSCEKVTISLLSGKSCTIWAEDSHSFTSDKLPEKVEYRVFDIIYDLLKRKGGKVKKGLGRGYRVGEEKCTRDTIMGTLAYEYYGKKDGESTLDPVFVLAAILDWANLARNCRGYIELI